ncbi:MAG: hypothetical protein ACJ789_12010 [Thermomicrobiales bacterium]
MPARDGNRRPRAARNQQAARERPNRIRGQKETRAPDPNARRILAIAVPQAATGIVGLIISIIGLVVAFPNMPMAIFAILAVQVGGYFLTRGEAPLGMRMAWIVGAIETAVILPVVALQTIIAREPYVSQSMGSAGPVLVATAIVALVQIGLAVFIAASSWEHPEEAGLIFLPLALLVPAVIGARHEILEENAVRALAQASLLAAGATVIAWALPRSSRPFVPAAALALQFLALWLSGHGPSFARTSDEVVPFMYASLLVLTVILTVGVSILSLYSRRIILAAEMTERSQQWERRHVNVDLPSMS